MNPKNVSGLRALAVVMTAGLALAGAPAVSSASAPAGATAVTGMQGEPLPSAPQDALLLSSNLLSVAVSDAFPQVLWYADRSSGATITGATSVLDRITLNGTERQVEVTSSRVSESEVTYRLTVPGLDGVRLDASLSVDKRVTTFKVTAVTDTPDFRVSTIDLPGQDLLSVDSTQPGATTATAVVAVNRNTTGDTIAPVTATTPADTAPKTSAYAIVNHDSLAAAIETNSVVLADRGNDNLRIHRQATKVGEQTRVGFWSGQWTYRHPEADFTEDLPWAKVTVTPDANADGEVNWQDGGIALRDIVVTGHGAEDVADTVITHIPYNFGSMATHPFLRSLDDIKRIALATDGLGQMSVNKGYQSEGHDSAHPDYGGNYNKRAGGLTDLNLLASEAAKYNAGIGVHVNATEAYPVAENFTDELVNPNGKAWNWLDQSYYIHQERDLLSGDVQKRFAQLREETHPNLKQLYLDVYYSQGWKQQSLARELGKQGWVISTEWSDRFERQSVWSHWANDESYGGATNKGLNSQLIRFVKNGLKDTWNPHPILGNAELRDFEGWTSEVDWNFFHDNVWQRNLPAKFLQQHEITTWDAHDITFTDGVRATDTGGRQFFVGDAKVLDGDAYLLPWDTQDATPKLYHYNADGGTTTWQLTDQFASATSFELYRLSDQGRVRVGALTPRDGKVTLEAAKGTAYVLQPKGGNSGLPVNTTWGQGSGVVDPGFNSGTLDAWRVTGQVSVERDAKGQYEGVFRPGAAGSLSQTVRGLEPGTYAANVQVEVEPGRTRRTTLSVTSGGTTTQNHVERATAYNYLNADEKQGTYHQTLETRFTVPAGQSTAVLTLATAAGDARVELDNVRVIRTKAPRATGDGVVVKEDFEDVTQGWYPFVKGNTGNIAGPRTHIAQRHAPFTQKGWNGKLIDDVIGDEESLKAHEERQGLVYRTVPQTARFEAGHRYKVSFDYQNSKSGWYSWETGVDQPGSTGPQFVPLSTTPMPEQRSTTRFTQEFVTGGCGDYYVGLRKVTGEGVETDFVLDNLVIEDLGESDTPGACATQAITGSPTQLVPGEPGTVTTTFTNRETSEVANVVQSLTVPEGWTATIRGSAETATVAPGATAKATWQVTVPAGTQPGSFPITSTAAYTLDGETLTVDAATSVQTLAEGRIPQSRMSIAGVSDFEPASPPTRVLDGNAGTGWHTLIAGPAPYPHWVSIDLGGTYDVRGLDYQIRMTNRMFKNYEIYVSTDGTSWGQPVRTGQFTSTAAVQHVDLPVTRGRFVKLVGLDSTTSGSSYGGADEINIWGTAVQ